MGGLTERAAAGLDVRRVAVLLVVVPLLSACGGLLGGSTLSRSELENKIEGWFDARLARNESVSDVRCNLRGNGGDVSTGEYHIYACVVAFVNGARANLGVRVEGEDWTIVSGPRR